MAGTGSRGPGQTEELAAVRTIALKAGDTVGAYRLVRLVGEGATGVVFEVEHTKIGRRAAMKILSPEYAARPSAVRRLVSEAQAVNRINHPHIVEITDVIESPGGDNAVVMELLEGQSLAQLLVTAGRVPPERFVPIMIQVADALAAAHAAGFIHRDLKPENIFLTVREGRADYVKLLDFGIAKSMSPDSQPEAVGGASASGDAAAQRAHVTIEGTFLGTPAYASPEQASGKKVDNRTDIYSFGVILYELICGRLPFEGQNLGEYLVKHLTIPPPPAPPEVVATPVGTALDAIARRCLEKDPAARFHAAGEIKEHLLHAFDGDGTTIVWQLPRGMNASRLLGLVGIAVAALAVSGFVAWRLARSSLEAEEAAWVARPPPPPPAPVLSPATPRARVVLGFMSDPPHAETRRVGDPTLLGLTPFSQTFDRQEGSVEFEMRLPGYEPLRVRASFDADGTVGGPLKKLARGGPKAATRSAPARTPAAPQPAAAAPQPPARKGGPSKEATLNPFAK